MEDMRRLGIPVSNEGLHAYTIMKGLNHGKTRRRSNKKRKNA